jgi:hypothetical protein
LRLSVFWPAVIFSTIGAIMLIISLAVREGFAPSLFMLVMGLVPLAILIHAHVRLGRLKKEGPFYNADVTKIERNPWGSKSLYGMPAKMHCMYTNEKGIKNYVTSRHYLIGYNDEKTDFKARVYVDKNEPNNYEIEVYG